MKEHELRSTIATLRPLHQTLASPRPDDWLSVHPEPGQTFDEYLRSDPPLPNDERRIIYMYPLGALTEAQCKIVVSTAEFTEHYLTLPIKLGEELPLSLVPSHARRHHWHWGDEQLLTTFITKELLLPRLPPDAVASIAFTAADLWPGKGFNFVYGQASFRKRVGVWSMYRKGDPDVDEESYRMCLMRNLKTATHEIGHILGMRHCIQSACNMNGCNNRIENDRRPLWLCPECMAKACWAAECDPRDRYEQLADCCSGMGLHTEHFFFRKSAAALASRVEAGNVT